MRFAKPALTHEEQAALLIRRGLIVPDHDTLLNCLRVVGYYRLCAYWHPFKQPDETFAPGTSFDTVWRRYVFDRHLRLAVMDAIERVEVALRTGLVTELAMRHGPFAHINPGNFPAAKMGQHARFLQELREEAERSRERFVQHFKATYDEFPDLPLWAAVETMTFGSMLTLFRMSEARVHKALARALGLSAPVLSSWLGTLSYVRNVCAHHARLWNRELAIRPMIPDVRHSPEWHTPVPISNHRVFAVLTMLRVLLLKVAPQSRWRERLFALFDKCREIPLPDMGIPTDWRRHALWR